MATKTTTPKKTAPPKKTSKSAKPAAAAKAQKPKAASAKAKPAAATKKREPRQRPATKASGLDLAAKVLADAGEPLAAKTIAERVIAAGWKTKGTTPHATLYAAIGREIEAKGNEARFRKVDRGLFTANVTTRKEA